MSFISLRAFSHARPFTTVAKPPSMGDDQVLAPSVAFGRALAQPRTEGCVVDSQIPRYLPSWEWLLNLIARVYSPTWYWCIVLSVDEGCAWQTTTLPPAATMAMLVIKPSLFPHLQTHPLAGFIGITSIHHSFALRLRFGSSTGYRTCLPSLTSQRLLP